MNGAHLHLVLNHLPIVGTYLSLAVLTFGVFRKNTTVQTMGLGLIILSSLLAIPAYLTGEPAEDILEAGRLANDSIVHAHEEMAEAALWISEITGVLAIIALVASIRNLRMARVLLMIVLLSGLINSVMWFRVGDSGGEIRHTEIRTNGGNPNSDRETEE